MSNGIIKKEYDFRISELCCEVSALCVFVDIRGFTSLTTALSQEAVGEFLSATRLEILRGDKEFREENLEKSRGSWSDSSQKRYRIKSEKLWDLYKHGKKLSDTTAHSKNHLSFPYCVTSIQGKLVPLFAYYKFLGDGILFVFELAPANEFSWVIDANVAQQDDTDQSVKEQLVTDISSVVLGPPQDQITLLDKEDRERVILEWISELCLWNAKASWDRELHAGTRIGRTALGIGVSEGTIFRHVTRDKHRHKSGSLSWDYYGDALNRAARLVNLAHPGGAVWDVTDDAFETRLHDCWYDLMHDLRSSNERPYYFAKYPAAVDIKGVGNLELYASGAVGAEQLNKADQLTWKEGAAKKIRHEFEHITVYEGFGKIPENPFSRHPDGRSIAYIVIPGNYPPKVKVVDYEFNNRDHIATNLGAEAYEQWQIRTMANKRRDLNLFEGKVVRLLQFSNETIDVAIPSGYFWAGSIEYRLDYSANTSPFSGADLIGPGTFKYEDKGEYCFIDYSGRKQFDLKNSPLGNHLGINLLLYGAHPQKKDYWLILLQSRSGLVHVEKGKLCPSASGTLNADDCQGSIVEKSICDYPLRLAAVRELRRELGITIDVKDERIKFSALTREYDRIGTPDAFYTICVSTEKTKAFTVHGEHKIAYSVGSIDQEIPEKDEWKNLFFLEVEINHSVNNTLGRITNVHKVITDTNITGNRETWLLKPDKDLLSQLKKPEINSLFGKPCTTALHCLLRHINESSQ